jgi:hypothetical protein
LHASVSSHRRAGEAASRLDALCTLVAVDVEHGYEIWLGLKAREILCD